MKSNSKIYLALLTMVTTMACAFVQNMVFPPTPTVIPPTPSATPLPPTSTPTFPPPTATVVFEAACPSLLADIIEVATDTTVRFADDEEPTRFLVIYTIRDDKLGQRQDIFVPEELRSEWDARAAHESIWNYFASLIPEEDRSYVTEFSIMSDGTDNVLGAVGPTFDNLSNWGLTVDILDTNDPYLLTFTLMHEFGHLRTLNSKQVSLDPLVFHNPDEQDIRERAISACHQYFTGMGCTRPASYLNEFFNRYWADFYPEWQEIELVEDEDARYSLLYDFYKIYQDQFLTEYAATSPLEDIAESWAFFVLSPKPELNSIANEKILFFYEYPELVILRQEILTRLCTEFPK